MVFPLGGQGIVDAAPLLAVFVNDARMVEVMAEMGCDVNVVERNGLSAVQVADALGCACGVGCCLGCGAGDDGCVAAVGFCGLKSVDNVRVFF